MNGSFYKLLTIAVISALGMNANATQSVTEDQQERQTSKTITVRDYDEKGTFTCLAYHQGDEVSLRKVKELSDRFDRAEAKAAEYIKRKKSEGYPIPSSVKSETSVLKDVKVGDFIKLVSEEYPEYPEANRTIKVVE